ncbi:MAG: hypothetical protein LBC27_02780 [Spirochaetaceae bacterium]|jgi:hypothetical protein|nr:hypothetical protein [Spirochaetaceae bacterium]
MNVSLMVKAGQARPVAAKTSTDGSERHFMSNCSQARGKAASQLTLKNLHFKQFGVFALSAI